MTITTKTGRILQDMSKPSAIELELAALRAENERLRANQAKPRSLSLKVSEKGAVSLYGMGRFPVTLYKQQWVKLFSVQEEIKAFIEANNGQLSQGKE